MVDIKNIPARLKSDCRFCVWKFEKRSGQKTKMPYNPANGDRARINNLRTFADFKTTLMTYAMGGYDGIGIAVGNGIGAFDIDHCIREDGTLNDTAATVLSIFPTAYVEKSPSGKGLRGFFGVPEDFVYDKTVYYINNRSKGLEVYMPGATNRFVTVTGDVYRTGEIPNDETAMTTLLDSLMKRNKQVQNTQLRHHSYLDDDAVIAHAEEASNSDKFKKLYAGDWEELYDSQSDADMALLSILAFWCGCDEEQMDRIFRTSGLMRDKWDRRQAGTTYGAISIRNTVNTCAAVYVPVNAQDIVDEEFVNISEPEKKITLDAALTKRLTGNDTITARYLHENSFEFRPNFKIFINTNHRPNITDLTLFESGRIKIIPFDRHFDEKEQDKGLKGFFAEPENMSGILNWMLEGYKLFRSQGLEMPDSVVQATMDYQMFSDKMGQFFSECLQPKADSELRRAAVYTRYKEWCAENGYRADSAKVLNAEIDKRYTVQKKRPADGVGSTTQIVLGVEFCLSETTKGEFNVVSE